MTIIWLCKSESFSNDEYQQVLKHNGFVTHVIPTLEFKFINDSALKDNLEKPESHSGMIFTSGRAVEAVSAIYSKLPVDIHRLWSSKKNFAIGKATNELLKSKMCLSGIGSDAGNAAQLANVILAETKPFDKPLFFPCGNLKRDELPTLLAKNDRDFKALTCYETNIHSRLKSNIDDLVCKKIIPKFCIFFSPSGVNYAAPLLMKNNLCNGETKFIAIGPTTNSALVHQNIPVYGICSEPSAQALINLLKS